MINNKNAIIRVKKETGYACYKQIVNSGRFVLSLNEEEESLIIRKGHLIRNT